MQVYVEDMKGGKRTISTVEEGMGNEWALLQIIILQKSIKELLSWKGAGLLGHLIWQLLDQLGSFLLSKVIDESVWEKITEGHAQVEAYH